MLYSVASVRIKEGKLEKFLEAFRKLVPTVRQEKGCYQYIVSVDLESTEVPDQNFEKNVVTFIEQWDSMDDFLNHMQTPHMKAQLEYEKGIVEEIVSLKLLKEA